MSVIVTNTRINHLFEKLTLIQAKCQERGTACQLLTEKMKRNLQVVYVCSDTAETE